MNGRNKGKMDSMVLPLMVAVTMYALFWGLVGEEPMYYTLKIIKNSDDE